MNGLFGLGDNFGPRPSQTGAQDAVAVAAAAAAAAEEGFYWGDAATKSYFERAERDMDRHWNTLVRPVLDRHPIDFSHVLDLGAGHGRNSAKLAPLARRITIVDINPENIRFCHERFGADSRFEFVCNNGASLAAVAAASVTFFYTFDSMVHFNPKVVRSYVNEAFRVMAPGAFGFFHYSNYDFLYANYLRMRRRRGFPFGKFMELFRGSPKKEFLKNPHWRNFMSRERFEQLAIAAGFMIVHSATVPWALIADLDAISLLRKPEL